MLEIYISVPAAHFVEPWGQNIDKKYDECILYFLRRVKFADINKLAVYYAAHLALYFIMWHFKSANDLNIFRSRNDELLWYIVYKTKQTSNINIL